MRLTAIFGLPAVAKIVVSALVLSFSWASAVGQRTTDILRAETLKLEILNGHCWMKY